MSFHRSANAPGEFVVRGITGTQYRLLQAEIKRMKIEYANY